VPITPCCHAVALHPPTPRLVADPQALGHHVRGGHLRHVVATPVACRHQALKLSEAEHSRALASREASLDALRVQLEGRAKELRAREDAARAGEQVSHEGVWAVGCGLWAVGCGLWAVGCGLWAVGCGLWAVGCGVRGGGHGLCVFARGVGWCEEAQCLRLGGHTV
jgi:hypothetical protein